jgi:hypothetical protein
LKQVDAIASEYDRRRSAIVSDFQKQKNSVETASKQEKQALSAKYEAQAEKKKADAKNHPDHAHWMIPQAKAALAKRDDKISLVAKSATTQIEAINEAERAALTELSIERKDAINDARNANNSTIATVQQSVTLWGRFLAWIAAGASVLFLFCVFLQEVYKRGSHTEPPVGMPSKVLMGQTATRRQQEQKQEQEQQEQPRNTKEHESPKDLYNKYRGRARGEWARYKEHESKGDKVQAAINKSKALHFIGLLEEMGGSAKIKADDPARLLIPTYKETLNTSDSTKLIIDQFNEPSL